MDGDRGGYTFHRPNGREQDDLNLAHPYQRTVAEQLGDRLFHLEWSNYEKRNHQSNVAYERSLYDLERESEQDGVHTTAA